MTEAACTVTKSNDMPNCRDARAHGMEYSYVHFPRNNSEILILHKFEMFLVITRKIPSPQTC